MKSTMEDLVRRGYVEKDIVSSVSTDVLKSWLTSKEASKRTLAIRTLSTRNEYSTKQLLESLIHEKALYTKLEICSILQKGNQQDIKIMIEYLGVIGNNQLHSIGKTSLKKSYPLPRDIIARTLAKMSIEYIDTLLEVLNTNDKIKIYEIIDAIGWMLFYHPENNKEYYFKKIKKLYFTNSKDEIMVWKICTCLSAFKNKESIALLKYIEHTHSIDIKKEAKRSLQLVYSDSLLTKL